MSLANHLLERLGTHGKCQGCSHADNPKVKGQLEQEDRVKEMCQKIVNEKNETLKEKRR